MSLEVTKMRKVELIDHNGNKNLAAQKLGISRRQVDPLIIIYKEKGKSGFVHGNRGHKPQKALDKSISKILSYFIRINTMILTSIILKSFLKLKKTYLFLINLFIILWLKKVYYPLRQERKQNENMQRTSY